MHPLPRVSTHHPILPIHPSTPAPLSSSASPGSSPSCPCPITNAYDCHRLTPAPDRSPCRVDIIREVVLVDHLHLAHSTLKIYWPESGYLLHRLSDITDTWRMLPALSLSK
eukprot:3988972-Heterocapsa_arctica.AAC.1